MLKLKSQQRVDMIILMLFVFNFVIEYQEQ